MQQVQDRLNFPIDTPSDEELQNLFEKERQLESIAMALAPPEQAEPRPTSHTRHRDTKTIASDTLRKKKRKAQRLARRRARA